MDSKDCSPTSEELAVNEANNHLAIQLYKVLASEHTNVFFSPFSLSTALAMLFCGCKEEAANEMRQVLGYEIAKIEDQDVKSCFENLLKALEGEQDGYTLASANSVLSDKAFFVKDEFKSLLEESFKALIQEVDFQNDSESAVEQINGWVKERTNNMIPKLLESLEPNTVMVILNAVYFKGFWENQFKEEDTFLQYFYNQGIEDNAKQVDMMHLKEKFPYLENESFKALQLPYKGNDISMLILLPNSRNGLEDLEDSLTTSFIHELQGQMHETKVEVALPKFHLEYSKSLKEQFQSLGMNILFEPGADFSGINDSKELYVSEIVHKAVIEINEEGAEAAAATAVVMMYRCITFVPEFIVDHPFLFIIYNRKNNIIYFMGRVDEL